MDVPSEKEISALLGGGYTVTVLEEAVSTNTALCEMAENGASGGAVLIAERQSGGKGRLGRSFSSRPGGLYMSLLLRHNLRLDKLGLLTPAAAVAVFITVEEVLGIGLAVKWVNDLFYGGKKVCGILMEAKTRPFEECADYAVLGIGLNVYAPEGGFGEELESIAGALLPAGCDMPGTLNRLAAGIVKRVFAYAENPDDDGIFNAYRERLFLLGKDVEVHRAGEVYRARVLSLNRDYTLSVAAENGETKTLISGEVSVREDFSE